MNRILFPIVLGLALNGCVSMHSGNPYVGRPITQVVRDLGPPDSVTDYQGGGRYFGWSTSDVRVQFGDAEDPANWLEPMNRMTAPDELDVEKLVSLPDHIVSPPFRAGPCSFTLVAEWDARANKWIARKAIRRGAGRGGHCGMRVVTE